MIDSSQDILTEPQAAALLHVEPRTCRLWRQQRGLPHFKPTSKIVRYRRADLLAWLDRFYVAMRQPPRRPRN